MNSSPSGELFLFVTDAPYPVAGVYQTLGAARCRRNYVRRGYFYTIYRIMTSGNGRCLLEEVEHGETGPRER